MPIFVYKGKSSSGNAVSGETESPTLDEAISLLKDRGITPQEVHEKEAASIIERLNEMLEPEPKLNDLILFSRQLYTLTKAGVPLLRAITGLIETSSNARLKKALISIAESLDAGRDLSTSLNQHPKIFSFLFVSMVQVGENTGRLDESFRIIAITLEREKETRQNIKKALRYPTMIAVALVGAIFVINMLLVPKLSKMFSSFKTELPTPTKIMIGFSNFTLDYWWVVVFGFIAAVSLYKYTVSTKEGRYAVDRFKLSVPIIGTIVHRATVARFARSFAITTSAGVPISQAMVVVAKSEDNTYFSAKILQMRDSIERGENLTNAAGNSGLFDSLVIQMIAVGEETGEVDTMLHEISEYYDREVEYGLDGLTASIEPIMISMAGVIILMLALGVFLPMWDIMGAAKSQTQ